MKAVSHWILLSWILVVPSLALSQSGSFQVKTAEYHDAAVADKDVMKSAKTEMWARVFWPEPLQGQRPLLVLLHGNHGTCGTGQAPRSDSSCDYTETGTCPSGYVVTPNHEGYNYVAEELAKKGYIVVSVNANLGITCGGGESGDWGLILARGRLVLKHIEKWYKITQGLEATPTAFGVTPNYFVGKVDINQVGLMGHSRGGEGVRAAHTLYSDTASIWQTRIPGLKIRGIFEVGAVDGQSDRTLDAFDTAWNQLLPMCDGDVSSLEGRMPFERMLTKGTEKSASNKSLWMVWGANHNFFNTEWQESDSYFCKDHQQIFSTNDYKSPQQQAVLSAALLNFFPAHVGAVLDPNAGQVFDTSFPLPAALTGVTRVEREFVPALLDTFSRPIESFATQASFQAVTAKKATLQYLNFDEPKAIKVEWQAMGPGTYVDIPWTTSVLDWQMYSFIDLRLQSKDMRNGSGQAPLDFSISLIQADGTMSSPVQLSSVTDLMGPANSTLTYQTVRIPVTAFRNVDLTKLKTIRMTFDLQSNGGVYIAGVRVSTAATAVPHFFSTRFRWDQMRPQAQPFAGSFAEPAFQGTATIRSIKFVPSHKQLLGEAAYEIRFASNQRFPISNALPTLRIGEKTIRLSRYVHDGQDRDLTFVVPENLITSFSTPTRMRIDIGASQRWNTTDFRRGDFIR